MEQAIALLHRRSAIINMASINQLRDYDFQYQLSSSGFTLACEYAPEINLHLPSDLCKLIEAFLVVRALFDVRLTIHYPFKPMLWVPADNTQLTRCLSEQHNAMYTVRNNYSPALDPEKDSLYMIVRFVRYMSG